MKTAYGRIMYAREASQVQRCHGLPHIGSYDIAQHSFNMLMILRHVFPDAPKKLLWAIVEHDMAERMAGDIPAPTKIRYPRIQKDIQSVEDFVSELVGLPSRNLTDELMRWMKGLDFLEFYFWIKEQTMMGNNRLRAELISVEAIWQSERVSSWVPKALSDLFYNAMTTDYFGVGNKGWGE